MMSHAFSVFYDLYFFYMKFGFKAKAMFSETVDFRDLCATIGPNEREKFGDIFLFGKR